ncbi:MAG: heme exporter protein CcmB [Deltaproteobacteria bacterium]|nr:heme exporter protein CcmB [Deltaproteobacteria bacterium]
MNGFTRNTLAIVRRELAGYYGSPVAYVFIVFFLLLCGFFTFYVSRFYEMGQADLRSFFQWHPWIFLFLMPSVAMRLWAEERRTGTLELLLTLPVTLAEAVIGKFLAAWLFVGIALLMTFPLVLTVCYLGDPDMGAVFCGYLGSLLMAGAYLSVGSMTSATTRNQVISFILTVTICLFLVLAGWPPVTDAMASWAPPWLVDVISGFSFMNHFASMERGVLDLRDVGYYISVIFFMLFATGVILQNRKAS